MILLRNIRETDLAALMSFSNVPGFINLSGDRSDIQEMISRSVKSFQEDEVASSKKGKYIFMAEDLDSGNILGTSMIAGQHGTDEMPHFYFQVGSEKKFSITINTGFIHGTLELRAETNGPSEISGLITNPEFRDHPERIGRQVSFVRFLFLGMNPKRFKNEIHAELLPPVNDQGKSALWEAIGRRFTNMDYMEADRLCQKNKEFILSLFPEGKIYTTFIDAEAREAIGKVNKMTEPVVHMLTKIGFQYKNQVDPFDGGPHYGANVGDLLPIQHLEKCSYSDQPISNASPQKGLLAKVDQPSGEFLAVSAEVVSDGRSLSVCRDRAKIEKILSLRSSETVSFMRYY